MRIDDDDDVDAFPTRSPSRRAEWLQMNTEFYMIATSMYRDDQLYIATMLNVCIMYKYHVYVRALYV